METLFKFMVFAWELGLTVEFGERIDMSFGGGQQRFFNLRAKDPKTNMMSEQIFTSFEEAENFLKAGHGDYICREIKVPSFNKYLEETNGKT